MTERQQHKLKGKEEKTGTKRQRQRQRQKRHRNDKKTVRLSQRGRWGQRLENMVYFDILLRGKFFVTNLRTFKSFFLSQIRRLEKSQMPSMPNISPGSASAPSPPFFWPGSGREGNLFTTCSTYVAFRNGIPDTV